MSSLALAQDDITPLGVRGGRSDARVTLQNQGPGTVWVDHADDVDATSGYELAPDATVQVSAEGCYVVAVGGAADLRILR